MWFLLHLPSALILIYFIYNRFLHPLSNVPGPFLASITPLWLAWQGFKGRRPRLDLALHRKYGSVVRISPDEVIFNNPAYFKEVYGAGTKFRKASFYEAPTDHTQPEGWNKLDMLVEQDIEKLRVQKRHAGPIYSTSNTKRHEDSIDSNIRRFVKRMKDNLSRPLDIYYEFEIYNVDMMTQLTFGEPYGALEKGSDDDHMAHMEKIWAWWGWIGYLPWLNWLDYTVAPWATMFNIGNVNLPVFPWCLGKIMAYQKAVDEGRKTPSGILDDMRKLSKSRPEFIENWGTMLAMTDLGAGVDTMSWTLATIIVGISSNPNAMSRVHAELTTALREGRLTKGSPVPYDEAAKLEYLQASMQEAMRLWPNIAISLPRVAPQDGIALDGHHIPAGYTIGLNSKELGLNEAIFGPDTASFQPERWLQADKARRNDMETRNLAFGGPSRKCPGMHLAWVCMSKLAASFFLELDVKILNRLDGAPGPGGHVWREKGAFPTKWHGLEVEITAR